MKLLMLLLLLAIGAVIIAAKPVKEPLYIIREGMTTCGWDCDPTDDVYGIDESYQWVAQGNLSEPFTHTYLTSGNRTATVRTWWKGKGDVTITINGVVFNTQTRLRNQNQVLACLEYMGDISITISGSVKLLNVDGHDFMRRTMDDCP